MIVRFILYGLVRSNDWNLLEFSVQGWSFHTSAETQDTVPVLSMISE
jgi:hypothetical protein